jgi:type II secretory pathway pseudopilin PulG
MRVREEEGIAILISVVIVLLLSAIAITAMQHSQQDAIGGGRARHQTRHLHAAEGALDVIVQQLSTEGADKEAAVVFPQFIQDPETGRWTTIMTALPDTGAQQDIANHGLKTKSGDSLAGPIRFYSYSVNVLASDMDPLMQQAGGRVGLQAQFAVLDTTGGGNYR